MPAILKKGSKAPDFTLKNEDRKSISLSAFTGKWVILYFYPKDDTPGCTQEAKDFSGLDPEIQKNGAVVLGISPDSEESHEKFAEKYNLSVELLSDPDHTVLEAYGVWQKKINYGKEYMGVSRTTYLIDPKGIIQNVWENVKVGGHAAEVNATMCSLKR
jgi:peroxiredoxin